MRIRLCVLMLGLGFLLMACGTPADEGAGELVSQETGSLASPSSVDVDYGPFLADDPFGAVAGLEWREMSGALPGGLIRDDGPIAVLVGDSTDETLHIAVNGGGCRPELRIAVVQPPPQLELGISVGDYIAPPGLECTDILTTHGFEVRLTERVSLDAVVLNPMLSEGGNDVLVVVPGAEGALPGDVWVSCPSGPSFPVSALDQISANLDTDPPNLLEAMERFLSDEEGQFWPQEGWQALHRTDETILLVHHDADSGGISFMDFEIEGFDWRWSGASSGGPCPLQITLPDGLGVVTWRLDPEAGPLTSETTSIPVLVTEVDCASGQPMEDRLVGPDVLMTGDEVLIVFGVTPLSGAQDCQGNPEQRVMVPLPEPLGDRVVRDGMDTGLDLADFLQ